MEQSAILQLEVFAYPNYLAATKIRLTLLPMGTVHKFTRPPKNENQFKGYRPLGPVPLKNAAKLSPKLKRWQKLLPWQRSLIAWTTLIVVAAAVVGVRMLIATIH